MKTHSAASISRASIPSGYATGLEDRRAVSRDRVLDSIVVIRESGLTIIELELELELD